MATTGLTRPHWAGTDADLDIHLELYQGDVDKEFEYNSYFKGKVTVKNVGGNSSTWRGDRFGNAVVKSRVAGGAVDKSRMVNEKFTITVEATCYVRTAIDYQDEWTAPSRRAEITQAHGSAMALNYDQAHIIQLIKSRTWTPPASLDGKGFFDGIDVSVNFNTIEDDATMTAQEKGENLADALERAHRGIITEFVKRRIPLGNIETLLRPEAYSVLMDHKKLLNTDFSNGNGSFADRRIGTLNGTKVVELNCWPDAAGTHPLGEVGVSAEAIAAFTVTADDVLAQMVVYHTGQSLVSVEAKSQEFRVWDDKENFANVMDTFSMFTVGQRRPDYVGVVSRSAAPTP